MDLGGIDEIFREHALKIVIVIGLALLYALYLIITKAPRSGGVLP